MYINLSNKNNLMHFLKPEDLKEDNSGEIKKEKEISQDYINKLEEKIRFYQEKYYAGQPEIPDSKFDALWDELKRLDPNNPIFDKVGKDEEKTLAKREHIIFMNSQDKVTIPKDFSKWAKKVNHPKYIVQFKLDGISLELQYRNGEYRFGVTRGNGYKGDDISNNVRKMKGFVQSIDKHFTGAVRAEILMEHSIFDTKYSEIYKNCRNTASGFSKRKDGSGCEDLAIICYDAINKDDANLFKSELSKISWIKDQGFITVDYKIFDNIEQVIKYRETVMNNIRNSLDFDIDGLVIKGNAIDLEDMRRTTPIKQIAFKFDTESSISKLIDIEWSESGKNYTPVAIIEPVELCGTTVSRASLSNPNKIKDLGVKIGSRVLISKHGDIIPDIDEVVETPLNAIEIEIPIICSICGTFLLNEGTRLYCPNKNCPKVEFHRLLKWIRKLDVKNFGEKLMRKLFDSKKVLKISDLYNLKISDISRFEREGERSAQVALDNLLAVKEISLAKFVAGFDIEDMGEKTLDTIVSAGYTTLGSLYNASPIELAKIHGIGSITARNVIKGIKFLHDEMMDVLNTQKIKIRGIDKMGGKLQGKSFCFTGKLETMNRKEAEEIVISNGGTIKSGVSKNLTYLVTNDTASGSAKNVKAQKLGVSIITEKEFLEIVK